MRKIKLMRQYVTSITSTIAFPLHYFEMNLNGIVDLENRQLMTQMNEEIDWNDDIRSIVQFRFHKLYILFSSKMTRLHFIIARMKITPNLMFFFQRRNDINMIHLWFCMSHNELCLVRIGCGIEEETWGREILAEPFLKSRQSEMFAWLNCLKID